MDYKMSRGPIQGFSVKKYGFKIVTKIYLIWP